MLAFAPYTLNSHSFPYRWLTIGILRCHIDYVTPVLRLIIIATRASNNTYKLTGHVNFLGIYLYVYVHAPNTCKFHLIPSRIIYPGIARNLFVILASVPVEYLLCYYYSLRCGGGSRQQLV